MKFTAMMSAVFCVALTSAGTSLASTGAPPPTGDEGLAQRAVHEVRMYPYYGIFDDVNIRVADGTVHLTGEVSQPVKKGDLGRIMARIPGVTAVDNDLRVAPLSRFDDQLRVQVANTLYRDPFLARYAMGAQPPIHILVDNGHITLEGVVRTDADKQVAGMRANQAMSFGTVTNNLRVEQPARKN